jgi:hypothetical protein
MDANERMARAAAAGYRAECVVAYDGPHGATGKVLGRTRKPYGSERYVAWERRMSRKYAGWCSFHPID